MTFDEMKRQLRAALDATPPTPSEKAEARFWLEVVRANMESEQRYMARRPFQRPMLDKYSAYELLYDLGIAIAWGDPR